MGPSPDPKVKGYFLCWGFGSGSCTNLLDAGNATNAAVTGLDADLIYCSTVVAYDATGDRAPPSNMVMYPPGTRLNIQARSDGVGSGVAVSFQGYMGTVYSVQAAIDFTNWATISTTDCFTAGSVTFPITDTASYPRRFYRLLEK